ncbi:MAG: DNA repair protein RecN [Microscillaceae bacterium]|jgi:DNA repair protein RecN (Recombination protein N)|nr:DNA repair protein RecN [Microscillaceae bacterium]
MLAELYIKNYALIEELAMKPHQSLNIITGETGAGKSIMLGAIGLLLGNRADTKALLNTEEKCVVEAIFEVGAYHLQAIFEEFDLDYQTSTTIRREINPSGKSRAFINDTPVTLDALKEIGFRLIDIHSQHDTLLLGNNLYQLNVVDAYAQNREILTQYQVYYRAYTQTRSRYHKLQTEFKDFQKEYDYNLFLWEELHKARLQAPEQEELENELQLLERAEEVKTKLNRILQFLSHSEHSALDELKSLVNGMNSIADLSLIFNDLRDRLESCRIELQDISKEIEREEEKIEFSTERIEEVNNRLSLIYNLQKKHQVTTIAELLQIEANLADKVKKVQNFDEELANAKAQLAEAQKTLLAQAEILSASRQDVIELIENELKGLLADLGMANATVKITLDRLEPTNEGIDLINFLFSANKGIAPQEISRVASGGEFSRLMLAIKYILAGKTALPTIIFDEIDTGISGEIALKMGQMFKKMSQRHQLIAISHLHQIAAKGNYHYFVYKDDSADRTVSRIKQLESDERIYTIAQMISGSTPSESAITSAKELLEVN